MQHCKSSDIAECFRSNPNQIYSACRICLQGVDNMVPLTTNTGNGSLIQLLMDFANIELHADQLGPTHICISCKNKLIISSEFKMMVHKSDMILNIVIEKLKQDPIQIENNISNTSWDSGLDNTKESTSEAWDTELTPIKDLQPKELNKNCDFSSDKKAWHCERCGKRCAGAAARRQHETAHLPGHPLQCALCGKTHHTREQFRRHVARHSKRLQCPECPRVFCVKAELRKHARRHSGEPRPKPHQCTRCDKRFVAKAPLQEHMRVHSAARAVQCVECGRGFASARLLRSHARVHTGDRPYKCELCGRAFKLSSTLTAHARTHTGDRPFVCAHCGKTFIQSSNLHLHMRTHTAAAAAESAADDPPASQQ